MQTLNCIHPYIHTSIHPYIHTSTHPYIHTSIHPYIHTSIHPYIHTSIHPYIHTSIHPGGRAVGRRRRRRRRSRPRSPDAPAHVANGRTGRGHALRQCQALLEHTRILETSEHCGQAWLVLPAPRLAPCDGGRRKRGCHDYCSSKMAPPPGIFKNRFEKLAGQPSHDARDLRKSVGSRARAGERRLARRASPASFRSPQTPDSRSI